MINELNINQKVGEIHIRIQDENLEITEQLNQKLIMNMVSNYKNVYNI